MPDHDHVICPGCGKAYRWKEAVVGRLVPCKKCGVEFIVPKHPGKGQRVEPEKADSEDSVYALALDLEEEPTPPPKPRPTPQREHIVPEPAVRPDGGPDTPSTGASVSEPESEEPVEVSEAVKARRREEQRLAAAAEAERSVGKLKLPILLAAGIGLVVVILLVLIFVSDALDGILG